MSDTDPFPRDLDPLRNLRDPLRKTGPDKQLELFRAMGKVAHGFGNDDVIGAAVNILINAIRGAYGNRDQAEARFNELMGRAKETLLNQHYDSVTKRRRNVFPFTQNIDMPLFKSDDKH